MSDVKYSAKDIARFWAKVDKSAGPNGCWLWTASRDGHGYGEFRIGGRKGRIFRSHRLSWEIAFGPIPDGLNVLHNCPDGDNPSCCNPAHLWLGTQMQNMADMIAKGRDRKAKGEQVGQAKYSDELVAKIRAEYIPYKISTIDLARKYGIGKSQVWNIVARKTRNS